MSLINLGVATTAGNYTLVFSGTTLPNTFAWVEEFLTVMEMETPVNHRQNFWSTEIVLDGGYPAFSWRHTFSVYTEATTSSTPHQPLFNFLRLYTNATSAVHGTKQELTLTDVTSSVVKIYFGPCYLESARLKNPDAFMKYRAGTMEFVFVGTSIPSVV